MVKKLTDKYKKNQDKMIELAKNAQILLIQNKIDQALDLLFTNENDDNIARK